MTSSRLVPPRPRAAAIALLGVVLALGACTFADAPRSAEPATPSATTTPSPTPDPTPEPTPTPAPTPRFTNEPDEELAALIPATAGGAEVIVAPFDEFALTPGDIGLAYGEIGDRFSSLALAYVAEPRLTLYAMRVEGEPV